MDEILDVAIVGGGIAGLYSGWRLLVDAPATPRPRVAIFEGGTRVGGRIATAAIPGAEGIPGDLGAQRFLGWHRHVAWLADRVGLTYHCAQLTAPLPKMLPNDLVYLRGRSFTNSQLTDPGFIPYALADGERGCDPVALLQRAIESVVPNFTSYDMDGLEQVLMTSSYKGRPLYSWGFWNLMAQLVSPEALAFIRDYNGYDFMFSNLNAVSMIRELRPVFPTTAYCGIAGGYDALPFAVATQYAEAGGELALGHRLAGFSMATLPDGSTGVRLRLCAESEAWGPGAGGRPVERFARSLILALPRRALELLDQDGEIMRADNRVLRDLLGTVTPIPIFKIFLCYHTPWWEQLGNLMGEVITDLPVRQCIYLSTQAGGPAPMLASFDDSQNVGYWEGLRPGPRRPAIPPGWRQLPLDVQHRTNWEDHSLPLDSALVQEAHRQVVLIHDPSGQHGVQAPPPYAAAAVDWTADPYGGAAHYWNHHVDYREVMPRLRRLAPYAPVFLCGEAYSRTQGWVEGALETAEDVLQHGAFPFRLAPPALPPQGAGAS